jgi:hypothetical protein
MYAYVDTRLAVFAKLAGQDASVEDHLGTGGSERVDGPREHLARLGPERYLRLVA